ncbi:hypothetical protein BJY04DRAFT_218765 [Aspergillus karnatakaensis]|uniref:uncharacterized protein n=1 Tax=Aspergillus karnatakaensis TaxID=1810916 RepID=UPI003CCD2A68
MAMESSTTPSKVVEVEGDLFGAPDGAALIRESHAGPHACNCLGGWGKGIAKAFRTKYPAAHEVYQAHCDWYGKSPQYLDTSNIVVSTGRITRQVQRPEGTALLIPPQKSDYEREGGKRHWIICLFTSRCYGRRVSSADVVLQNTELAIADLKVQLDILKSGYLGPDVVAITELWSCRFNSGLFKVDWKYSREILDESGLETTVVRPPEEEDEDE